MPCNLQCQTWLGLLLIVCGICTSEDLGICRYPGTNLSTLPGEDYSLSHPWAPGCGHLPWQRWLGVSGHLERRNPRRHEKQLHLEQNSSSEEPKGAESMGLKGLVGSGSTDTCRCSPLSSEHWSLWLATAEDMTEVDEKRGVLLLTVEARPHEASEAQAF